MNKFKTWNVRDQTEESLKDILQCKYKEINADFKLLRKISNIDDAKKMVDQIWVAKRFANSIELELIRREYQNGTTSE